MDPRYALLAACMMHVEGAYSTKSRAFLNSNPGNIEYPDGRMRVYASHLEGFIALVDDIAANAGKPLNVFIAKYAPPSENDTSMYLTEVAALSGMAQDEVL